jgi:nucleoid-associated protein YgaU
MSLQEKYRSVLELGQSMNVKDGYVKEENGKLKIGGTVAYQYDKDRLWDEIKRVGGEMASDIEADIKVENTEIYGIYTVQPGDTLGKLAKQFLGKSSRYMEIFNLNTDQLSNPDLIKVGQKLKIPNK